MLDAQRRSIDARNRSSRDAQELNEEQQEKLEVMTYAAAQTDAKMFIRVLFSTTVGRLVFNRYKNKMTLPEDLARQNGHHGMARTLENFHLT